MQISFNSPQKISFGTNHRNYHAGPLHDKIYTATYVCRQDFPFKDFTDYMVENYKSAPKVNVYSLACSDGSEAWTLAMFLRERNAHKFLPIKGVDIDGIILNSANSKMLNAKEKEIARLKALGVDFNKYFVPSKSKMNILRDSMNSETKTYAVKDFMKNDFHAERKTILQQVREMSNEAPNVVLCRNVFPYIGDNYEALHYIKAFADKLAVDDLLAIGDYDRGKVFIDNLKRFGFTEIMYNVFKKVR